MNKILTIIPAYNKEEFLEGAIESVLQQTHPHKELIIIDDCSIDKTLEIAKSYEHLDNVTVLSNVKNKGCYNSLNQGLKYAFNNLEWDYYTFHGADDLSDINRYSKLLLKFNDPSLMGLKSTYVRVDRELHPQLTPQGQYDIYASEGIAFYPKKTINLLGYYDNTRTAGDTDYWWRLEALCSKNPQYKVGISDEILYYAINHENNLTKTNPIASRATYYKKIQEDIRQMFLDNNFYRNKFE